MSQQPAPLTATPISRRAALHSGFVGAGVSLTAATTPRYATAQEATPAGMLTEQLEVDVVVSDPVTITLAGGGPPQRGDHFYIDGPIYAAGDAGGVQIGQYNCFGVWTTTADDTSATYQRLTTVQFRLDDGSIMGLINEGGTGPNVGAIQGGSERYTGALGTFTQTVVEGVTPGTDAGATPAPAGTLVQAVLDLILPPQS